jgi:hypothetical protein
MRILILCLFLTGCSGVKHWRYVATDTHVTPEKKSIVAPKMAVLFPPQVKHVPGETVVKVDTVINERYEVIRDTITGVDTVVKYRERTVTKEVRIVDTVYTVDNATVYSLQQELATATTLYKAAVTLNDEKDKSIDRLQKGQQKWLWWLLGLIALNIVYIVIKLVK